MGRFFLLVSVISSFSAFGGVVGFRASGDTYFGLKLTQAGNVAFSVCPNSPKPVSNCDVTGKSTMVIDKDAFESWLASPEAFDEVTVEANKDLKDNQDSKLSHENWLAHTKKQIAARQDALQNLQIRMTAISDQIASAKKKLRLQPDMDPIDRKELEAFIVKAEAQLAKLQNETIKLQTEVSALERSKVAYEQHLAIVVKQIGDLEVALKARKAHLTQKAETLRKVLPSQPDTESYEKETLYFLAFGAFTTAALPDVSSCRATVSYSDVFGSLRTTLDLSKGVYPMTFDFSKRAYELVNGATYNFPNLETKERWKHDKKLFTFSSPRQKTNVLCAAQEISGQAADFFWMKYENGDVVDDDFCTLNHGREIDMRDRTYIKFFNIGRMSQAQAAETCKDVKRTQVEVDRSFSGPNDVWVYEYDDVTVFGDVYQQNKTLEGRAVQDLSKNSAAIINALKVTGNPVLEDGYYAWADAEEPYVFRFRPGGSTEVVKIDGMHEAAMKTWQLPTLCSVRVDTQYCDK
jgi:hypothetical protein